MCQRLDPSHQLVGNLLGQRAHLLDADDLRACSRASQLGEALLRRQARMPLTFQERMRAVGLLATLVSPLGAQSTGGSADRGSGRCSRASPCSKRLRSRAESVEADLAPAQRQLDRAAHPLDQRAARRTGRSESTSLHVVALHHVLDVVAGPRRRAARARRRCRRRGCGGRRGSPGRRRPGTPRCSRALPFHGCSSSTSLHVARVDELVDLAVAVAGEVREHAAPGGLSSSRWIGITGKSCLTAQWSGADWNTEKFP